MKLSIFFIMAATALTATAQRTSKPLATASRAIVSGASAQRAGEQMNVAMTLCLDSMPITANRRVVLTPMLVGRHDSVALRPIVINGRRQQIMYDRRDGKKYGDDALVVNYAKCDSLVGYSDQTAYADWMRNADLRINEDLCGCGNVDEQQHTTVSRMREPLVAYAKPALQQGPKTYEMKASAYIDFPVNRTELHPNYRRNPAELAKIIDTINVVKRDANMTITHIDIHGYASPESPYSHNAYLAENRAATLKNYVRQLVSLSDTIFSVSSTPEDWEGLCSRIADSNLDNRDDILAIASNDALDPDAREAKIKAAYPEQYRFMLSTWYPALRHSDYTISCTVRPFTVEEAKEMLKTNPKLVSQEEMFMVAQTYEPGSKEFNEVMETAVRMFPADETANLNAACTRLAVGRYAEAKPYLDKAGNSADAMNARGAYYVGLNDYSEAQKWFAKAAAAGSEAAKENLENIMQ